MKLLLIPFLMSLSFVNFAEESKNVPDNISSLQQLLEQVKSDGLKESNVSLQREALFKKSLDSQLKLKNETRIKLNRIRKESERLKKTFDSNETSLSDLESELRKRLGNLGEMFGVVRQISQDVSSIRYHSLIANEIGAESEILEQLSNSKALPTITELEDMWYEIQLHMTKQGENKSYKTSFLNLQGVTEESEIHHIGPFVAFNSKGYLSYEADSQALFQLGEQSSNIDIIESYLNGVDEFNEITMDLTRGTLLNLNSQSPGLLDRVKQGGTIGYIIIILAALGILYGAYLLFEKVNTQLKINKQLRDFEKPSENNPLGRVLLSYNKESTESDLETLEMKLDEAVLRELPHLEKGLSIIKLLAAVAPLLGLLGTVTGMIATFQSITLFGTGDPKLMAGGISQALVTTVLGLVGAIPLLFMHNILNSRSKSMIQILDQQSAGIVAEHIQKGR
ncbi:MotA/TolQ/ExbB proton channel family protein [Oceaniserpentilla sp. 4NH20-0058]|uniref:MotA/TolQ/ExbB proton channel family protein n=1 Tax=Oceaniserpentilla sp. 4NH20-0058 TaxID=3127660 RepID=UPI00310BAEDC